MLAVLGAEAVDQPRRLGHHRAGALVVGVERAQRVGFEPPAHLLRQLFLARAQVVAQLVQVGGPRLGRAEARHAQPRRPRARALDDLCQQQDQLGVEAGVVRADRLGAHLRELPEAPGLGRLVAEERPPVPELHRLRELVHAVLDVGAADAGGALGPQRQRPPGLVLEGEHLLLHDVGGLPDAAREQVGVLEDRRVERLVARPPEHLCDQPLQAQAAARVAREDVGGAPGGLEAPAHRDSSARNGLLARSAPRVVVPMWPG